MTVNMMSKPVSFGARLPQSRPTPAPAPQPETLFAGEDAKKLSNEATRRRTRRRAGVGALVLASLLALAGCGSAVAAPSAATPAPAPAPSNLFDGDHLTYAGGDSPATIKQKCMDQAKAFDKEFHGAATSYQCDVNEQSRDNNSTITIPLPVHEQTP